MKAAQISQYGHADVIELVDIPTPTIRDDQVLVQVQASSLNPFDSKIREGVMKDTIPLQFPVTLGGDIAGVVTEVGATVKNIVVGDKVYGQANVLSGNSGALAEYAATLAAQVAVAPKNSSIADIGALPLVGVSAVQAIETHCNLQPGQKILIHGGTGGIGSIAVQIAKHIGAYVAATVPPEAVAFAHERGIDEAIDYKSQKFEELIKDYDAVFDTAGGTFEKSLAVLKEGGVFVTMLGEADEEAAKKHGITAINQQTRVTSDALSRLTELVEAGVVSVHVALSFPLDQIQEAFKKRESGGIHGKIGIQIQ
jgi:NADPH:quinone reductase-like Zn-dependent oxidoreductase